MSYPLIAQSLGETITQIVHFSHGHKEAYDGVITKSIKQGEFIKARLISGKLSPNFHNDNFDIIELIRDKTYGKTPVTSDEQSYFSSVQDLGETVTQEIYFTKGNVRTFKGIITKKIKQGRYTILELTNGIILVVNTKNVSHFHVIPE